MCCNPSVTTRAVRASDTAPDRITRATRSASADALGPVTSDRQSAMVAPRQAHHQREQHVPDDARSSRPGTRSSPPHHGLGQSAQREQRSRGTQKGRPADRYGCHHHKRDKRSRKAGAPERADGGRSRVEGGTNAEGFTSNAVASSDGRPCEVEGDQRAEAPAGSRHTSMGQRHTLDRTGRARHSRHRRNHPHVHHQTRPPLLRHRQTNLRPITPLLAPPEQEIRTPMRSGRFRSSVSRWRSPGTHQS